MKPTIGDPVSVPTPRDADAAPLSFDELAILELDETIPPRPEEDAADVARATPDAHGHGAGTGPVGAVDPADPARSAGG